MILYSFLIVTHTCESYWKHLFKFRCVSRANGHYIFLAGNKSWRTERGRLVERQVHNATCDEKRKISDYTFYPGELCFKIGKNDAHQGNKAAGKEVYVRWWDSCSWWYCQRIQEAVPYQVMVRWGCFKPTKTPERQEEAAPRENKRNTEEKNIICDERLGRSCL